MKPLIATCVGAVFILSISCTQKKQLPHTEFSGTYIEQPDYPHHPATLKIMQLDNSIYMIKLDSAKTVVVARDGMLSGVFIVPLKGEFPFNFHVNNNQTGILRIKNKIIRFKKTIA